MSSWSTGKITAMSRSLLSYRWARARDCEDATTAASANTSLGFLQPQKARKADRETQQQQQHTRALPRIRTTSAISGDVVTQSPCMSRSKGRAHPLPRPATPVTGLVTAVASLSPWAFNSLLILSRSESPVPSVEAMLCSPAASAAIICTVQGSRSVAMLRWNTATETIASHSFRILPHSSASKQRTV